MQIVATVLQLLGAVVTGAGLLYAWNRASGRFEQWRHTVMSIRQSAISKLAAVRAQATGHYTGDASAVITSTATAEGMVTRRTADPPEVRLDRIEQEVAQLASRTKEDIEAVETGIDEKLAALDANGKAFAVKDIYWALGGILIQITGYLVRLHAQLTS